MITCMHMYIPVPAFPVCQRMEADQVARNVWVVAVHVGLCIVRKRFS